MDAGSASARADFALTPSNLKVGQQVYSSGDINTGNSFWIITDVLGDGKFKAVPKDRAGLAFEAGGGGLNHQVSGYPLSDYQETFDISGKVDTNNPIYKFYEKDLGKYLQKYGAKRITDSKGVSWYELPITKEQGKAPVEAFGKVQLNPLLVGAGILGAGVIGTKALTNKK